MEIRNKTDAKTWVEQLGAVRRGLTRQERHVPLDMDGSIYHERLVPATHACLTCGTKTSMPEKHRGHVVVRRG